MGQHDYVLDNESGAAFRVDVNYALLAIVSQNAGPAEPLNPFAYMWWMDTSTTPAVIKIRNASNTAWVILPFRIDQQTLKASIIEEGTAGTGVSVDGLTFKDAGIALGSDADGDLYYRLGGALKRLAKGLPGTALIMNAAGTAPEWGSSIPSGSKMVFFQAAAPAGWTQDTTLNDYMLRIVSGTGGGHGGTSSPIASHIHSTGSHALTIAEMPSHNHRGQCGGGNGGPYSRTYYGSGFGGGTPDDGWFTYYTASNGSNYSHNHGNTGSSFTPKYANMILCTKN